MKQNSFNLKTLRNVMLLLFLNLSFSAFANNYIDVEVASNSNAVDKAISGSSNGINTYKTFTFTIPFYSSTLNEINIKSNWPYGCNGDVMINVDGINSTYSGYQDTSLHKWFKISNLSVGTTTYLVKTLCGPNEVEVANSRHLIKVVVVKEADPVINLTLGAKCAKDKNGKYTGYINLTAEGSYTNASKLYLKITTPASGCNYSPLYKMVHLGNSNAPNNTVSNSGFYNCSSNGIYKVELFYKSPSPSGNGVMEKINSGQFGWTDYSFNKWSKTCRNLVIAEPVLMHFKNAAPLEESPVVLTNPVKEELDLFLNSDTNTNYEVEIYDFSGISVKRASFKNVTSKSKNTINVQDLKKGIYVVSIKNGDSIIRKKMIKE
ncbi:T9SS type A sorting domain-containing protein [Bizionia myxarmorum]|uniref:T9SS type A sorting domain-containing protein n=1 Tax=Bizionia myxarmorum TaxID=291186 RepID=A0A5D0R0S7_9FLAO|nr:T9SS type A sorting domain-containing protein [Bizionia myxarmorum]TYB74288.1 T9SS type A sorting domain-containing protein [Bizionia myxarmorum]